MNFTNSIRRATELLHEADGLLITAGAGMGVDSGLPDFRSDEGFWRAYPPFRKAGIRFTEIASPATFQGDPALAWGFYGHRLQLYRDTVPHEGFSILLEFAQRMQNGYFVFTSNVDGQFQKAGFDGNRIVECHGSIHVLQCLHPCTDGIWSANQIVSEIDDACQMTSALPRCPHCSSLARPNILMFNDSQWLSSRTDAQHKRLDAWLTDLKKPVIVEIGAGMDIPSVRRFGQGIGAPLIRINPRRYSVERSIDVGIGLTCARALDELSKTWKEAPATRPVAP